MQLDMYMNVTQAFLMAARGGFMTVLALSGKLQAKADIAPLLSGLVQQSLAVSKVEHCSAVSASGANGIPIRLRPHRWGRSWASMLLPWRPRPLD